MIYSYLCRKCNKTTEAYRTVATRNDVPACPECGGQTVKIVDVSRVFLNTGKGSRIPGLCTTLPGEPVYVKSKHHFRELCKERDAGTPVNL